MQQKNCAMIIPVLLNTSSIPAFSRYDPIPFDPKNIKRAIPITISGNAIGKSIIILKNPFKGNSYLLSVYAIGIQQTITNMADTIEVVKVREIAKIISSENNASTNP
ncbi:hypothetical protein [Methanobrevibacter arboriphilus]|uniref:hypothetical protein n=1 Tax=Methanobrevibacter arboriphilus TaxID=39441 RepID=UPI001CDAFA92|nr:hypothetical protein [Methanobrevibacter arboriphilus]